jgi:hypothetical protein
VNWAWLYDRMSAEQQAYWDEVMESYDGEFSSVPAWAPPHPAVAGGMDVQKSRIAEWQLDKDGLAIKGCAIDDVGSGGLRYGLVIARRGEDGSFDDPRNMTREQIETIRDFLGFMLEDSEG